MHQRPIHKSFWGLPNFFLRWNLTLPQNQTEPNQFPNSAKKLISCPYGPGVDLIQLDNMLIQRFKVVISGHVDQKIPTD